jgi:hypothetical protein
MSGIRSAINCRRLFTTTAAGVAAGAGLLRAQAALGQVSGPNHGPTLFTGQVLGVGQYLVSADGLFFTIMQGDGNFCVYRGSGPGNQGAFVWGSVQAAGYQPAPGSYFIIMQNDGNLCGYRGAGPSNKGGFMWGSVQLGHYQPSAGQYLAAFVIGTGSLCVFRQGSASPLFATNHA